MHPNLLQGFEALARNAVRYVPARLTVAEIFSPRSVAVIGASEDVGKFGGRVLYHLIAASASLYRWGTRLM
jgi:hypothetical protein